MEQYKSPKITIARPINLHVRTLEDRSGSISPSNMTSAKNEGELQVTDQSKHRLHPRFTVDNTGHHYKHMSSSLANISNSGSLTQRLEHTNGQLSPTEQARRSQVILNHIYSILEKRKGAQSTT